MNTTPPLLPSAAGPVGLRSGTATSWVAPSGDSVGIIHAELAGVQNRTAAPGDSKDTVHRALAGGSNDAPGPESDGPTEPDLAPVPPLIPAPEPTAPKTVTGLAGDASERSIHTPDNEGYCAPGGRR